MDAAARKWNRVRQCLKWGQVGRPITPKSLSYEYIFYLQHTFDVAFRTHSSFSNSYCCVETVN